MTVTIDLNPEVPSPGGAAQKAEAFRTFAREQRHTPPLSDEAVNRANLVRD